jgi:hypothetical protein
MKRQCSNWEIMSYSIPSSLKDTPIVDSAEAAARKAFVSFHVASGGILLAMSVFHCSICRDTTVNVSTFDALNGRAGRVSLSYTLPSDPAKLVKDQNRQFRILEDSKHSECSSKALPSRSYSILEGL